MANKNVYGGSQMTVRGQMRVVFCGTRKAMAAALNIGLGACQTWYTQTGNAQEIKTAQKSPGTLLYRPLDSWADEWITNPND